MTKNSKLYQAALHLYEAAKYLTEIDMVRKNVILDLSNDCVDEIELTEESEIEYKEIEEYAKEIRGVE